MAFIHRNILNTSLGWIRNLLYLTALLVALPWLVWRSFRTGRYRAGWSQKLLGLSGEPRASNSSSPLIWLHGVSVGEVQLLKSLLARWQSQRPEYRFALSTTTASGMHLARQSLIDGSLMKSVELFYFPLDFTWAVARTMRHLQPKLLVLGELELWPNLIDHCLLKEIPVAVINGRLSPKSFARYQRFSWLTRSMFDKLSLVAAQSEANAERFRKCGAEDATMVSGSIKFDNVTFDRQAPQIVHLRHLIGLEAQHRVWVMGSTQPGEELPAVETWRQLHRQFPELKLIVVPRHPERFDAVAEAIQRAGVRLRRRSQLPQTNSADDWDVLLVDSVGELRWWWGLAEIAIVGGSFGARGGQNMLEPAAYGANVAFGPNTTNFRDIVDLLLAGDAAVRLPTLAAMTDWIRQELLHPQAGQERGTRARHIIDSGSGALDRTIVALELRIFNPKVTLIAPVSKHPKQR